MTNGPQKDATPEEAFMAAMKNMNLLIENAAQIARYKRAMYLEFIGAGFTEQQALELVKGTLI